jgi:hypothetical protein
MLLVYDISGVDVGTISAADKRYSQRQIYQSWLRRQFEMFLPDNGHLWKWAIAKA